MPLKVGDICLCRGEAQTRFKVTAVEDGRAWLVHMSGLDHGWEMQEKLRLAPGRSPTLPPSWERPVQGIETRFGPASRIGHPTRTFTLCSDGVRGTEDGAPDVLFTWDEITVIYP